MKKVGVVLSGCGVYDGAEIHESVITLLALDRAGAQIICLAPNIDQMHVINHLTGEEVKREKRNVLVESARIARGDIQDIAQATANDFDALIFPGGFGAAKNLCNFAVKGTDCEVNPQVARLVGETHQAGKPIGFICIAPAMAAKIFQEAGIAGVRLTIGTDKGTADAINSMGAVHVDCDVRNAVVDEDNKVVTTAAYMLAGNISEAAEGIEKLVDMIIGMA